MHWLWSLAVVAVLGCYQPPEIPPDKALPCSGSDSTCPKGYACVSQKVCAPTRCSKSAECPAGLVCTMGRGCTTPPETDGGTDAGTEPAGDAGGNNG